MPAMTQYTPELIERFYSKISKIPTEQGCLEWMAFYNVEGYGSFGVGPHTIKRAHRVAWEIANGPIPAGMVVRHFVCANPRCCNVAHLRLGSQADNVRDMMSSGRWMNAPNTNAPYVKRTDVERFYAKVSKTPNETGCLDWLGGLRNGYGHFNTRGKYFYAHRLAWELVNGPIPDGLYVCHSCDRPICCNVEHLFLGTSADNLRDMRGKGRGAAPPIRKGAENNKTKLSDADVLEIRGKKYDGWKQRDIAKVFGVSQHTIWCILLRKTWTHI